MARINIEESLFKDVRFDDLKMKLGSVDTALGAMVRAWSLAQKWYLKEETSRLIPITEWRKQRISDFIIEVGLAEVRNDGIYVSGSESQFAWLLQRQSAGKKGGRPSNRNKEEMRKGPVKVPLRAESGSNPLSLSLSLSQDNKKNIKKETAADAAQDQGPSDFCEKESGAEKLHRIWNKNCGPLPKALLLSDKRRRAAQARWNEFPDEDFWENVVTLLSKSEFCCGKNERKWKADFDFFIKPDTHLRVNEGKYGCNPTLLQSGKVIF